MVGRRCRVIVVVLVMAAVSLATMFSETAAAVVPPGTRLVCSALVNPCAPYQGGGWIWNQATEDLTPTWSGWTRLNASCADPAGDGAELGTGPSSPDLRPRAGECPGVAAYRWTGSGWVGLTAPTMRWIRSGAVPGGIPAVHAEVTDYYVWPFTQDWSWVWSTSTGWVAVRATEVQSRPDPTWARANLTWVGCNNVAGTVDGNIPGDACFYR